MTKDEALALALEALHSEKFNKAVTLLRKALEQPEQEPTCPHCKDYRAMYIKVRDELVAEQQAEPCVGKDPRCPCQDGDACHYKDCGSTKALPVPVAQPEQEPTPWRDMVVVTLVREGIDKHKARELADHFATQRPWQGLTDEEIWNAVSRIGTADSDVNPYITIKDARAIEAKLKEKNI